MGEQRQSAANLPGFLAMELVATLLDAALEELGLEQVGRVLCRVLVLVLLSKIWKNGVGEDAIEEMQEGIAFQV